MTTEPILCVFPVSIDSIDASVLEVDLYLRASGAAPPVLYRGTGIEFSDADRVRLAEQGVEFVYIPMVQHRVYRKLLQARLDRLFRDPKRGRRERARIIQEACAQSIRDVLIFPGQQTMVDAVGELATHFLEWARQSPREFSYLLDMSDHDYYTATHMVNVGVGAGLLYRQLCGAEEPNGAAIMQGAMLHDIGKRGVSEELLNKEGKLTPAEWELVRLHPARGCQELMQIPGIPGVVADMARDHHEKLDGTGYPNGLCGEQIGFAARLCAIVDVYDALVSARPYRGPTPPTDALATMHAADQTHFDVELLESWSSLIQQLVEEDPKRVTAGAAARPAGGSHVRVDGRDAVDAAVLTDRAKRRRHRRFKCDAPVRVCFVYCGKPRPVPPGQWVTLRIVDISQRGMQLRTPWPLSINDVLDLEAAGAQGTVVRRRGRVVRVRRAGGQDWSAGVCFVRRPVLPMGGPEAPEPAAGSVTPPSA